jgi:hypothetical protein
VKLEHPHGSIERSEKALRRRQRWWQWLQGEFSIYLSLYLSFCLLLTEADGKREREKGRKQRCAREGKNHRVKKRGDRAIRDPNHPY